MKRILTLSYLAIIASFAWNSTAQAALDVNYQFNGNGNWAIDAVGSRNTPVGNLQAVIPLGSQVEAAFLYTTYTPFNAQDPNIVFSGQRYTGAVWQFLGANDINLRAYRANVTAQVQSLVGNGSDTPFSFTVNSEFPNANIDGEVLAVVYSNPNEAERTLAFLDGFSNSTGDETLINLAEPLSAEQLGSSDFQAALSLGIGFSYQGTPSEVNETQFSEVFVNGQLLTNCAGGQDDGTDRDGGLITVGGFGDSLDGPNCDATGARQDDELYLINEFLDVGDDQIVINTRNPSRDDNIFFAGVSITAVAGVNAPPPDLPPSDDDNGGNNDDDNGNNDDGDPDDPVSVNEPASLSLILVGMLMMSALRRRRQPIA